jgi:hypothetical protein
MTCHAPDDKGRKRIVHKSALGMYDGKLIASCVWCGATLWAEPAPAVTSAEEKFPICRVSRTGNSVKEQL